MILGLANILIVATPPPGAPLKEIGRVKSSAFCANLGRIVAPVIDGAIRNDALINAARRNFLMMGNDLTQNNPSDLSVGEMQADNIVTALAKNLSIMDGIIHEIPETNNIDDSQAAGIKLDLDQIIKSQRDTLDLMAGILDSSKLGRIKNTAPNDIASVVSPNTTPHLKEEQRARTYIDVA